MKFAPPMKKTTPALKRNPPLTPTTKARPAPREQKQEQQQGEPLK